LFFNQSGSIVSAHYRGGSIVEGYLVGYLSGASFSFRCVQAQVIGRLDVGAFDGVLERTVNGGAAVDGALQVDHATRVRNQIIRGSDGGGHRLMGAPAEGRCPATDTAWDADRKPAETLAFAGVRTGDKVADYAAGSGYFTRLFADVVGPGGHLYAVVPSPLFVYPNIVKGIAEVQAFAVSHPNVTVTFASAMEGVRFPEKLDLFWISQNYHDLKDPFMGPVDMTAFNKAVYTALKPGGTYVVLDHSAIVGAPADVTDTLHRIDTSTVRREVEAAGFQFDGESALLANPDDRRTATVFDKSIRGHTDQFILKFKKPKARDLPTVKDRRLRKPTQ
jgi:predicted methyltransferase